MMFAREITAPCRQYQTIYGPMGITKKKLIRCLCHFKINQVLLPQKKKKKPTLHVLGLILP